MSNVLAALGGAAAGIANAVQQNRMFNMQKVLAQAELASQGGAPALAAPDPNDPTGGGSASGSNGGGVVAPPSPAAGLMTGNPMASAPAVAAAPSGLLGGAGNTTQGGTVGQPAGAGNGTAAQPAPQAGNATQAGVGSVPTNQADVINLARAAASGPSPLSSGAPTGALAALNGASKVGASATPVGTDPIGGANSGLIASVLAPPKMVPVGNMGGQQWSVPQGMAAPQLQARSAVLNALLQGGLQSQQQQFLGGEAEKQRTFETGEHQEVLQQQQALATQRDQLERDLGKATNAVQYAGIAAQIRHSDAEMAMLGFRQGDLEQGKVITDLKPMEDQLPTIAKFQAITPDMAKNNPVAVQQALLETLQSGLGGKQFQSRLATLAKAAPGSSIEQVSTRFAQGLANGTIPTDQFQNLQQQVQTNKDALRQQHATMLAQDLKQYPMAARNPAIAGRTDALFGPAGSSAAASPADPVAHGVIAKGGSYKDYLKARGVSGNATQASP